MRFTVKVKPNSKQPRIEKLGDKSFKVSVREPARDGKANQAVIKALAEHLGVAPTQARLASGWKSKTKIIEITKSAN